MNNINRPSDAYAIAGLSRQICMDAIQEEVYMEEVEEELRIVLISSDAPEDRDRNDAEDAAPGSQIQLAIEDLITGDADDMPLDEEVVRSLVHFAVKDAQQN